MTTKETIEAVLSGAYIIIKHNENGRERMASLHRAGEYVSLEKSGSCALLISAKPEDYRELEQYITREGYTFNSFIF